MNIIFLSVESTLVKYPTLLRYKKSEGLNIALLGPNP
jgi:hypothetical protein